MSPDACAEARAHVEAEALRYLGLDGHPPAPETLASVRHTLQSASDLLSFKEIHMDCALECTRGGIALGGHEIPSLQLARLGRCARGAVLLVGTLGLASDRFARMRMALGVHEGAVAQAALAALLEYHLDQLCATIQREHPHACLSPRFSPGYGDVALTHQRALLSMLGAERIGVTANDAHMMTPLKSVTAIVFLTGEHQPASRNRCQACGKLDCMYRRNGTDDIS